MLDGHALMGTRMRNGGDEPGLPIVPVDLCDPRHLAAGRARAVGCGEQGGAQPAPVGQLKFETGGAGVTRGDARGDCRNSCGLQFVRQREQQVALVNDVRQRLLGRLKSQESLPHRILEAAVGDPHLPNGLHGSFNLRPNADLYQQRAARRGDRVGAPAGRRPRCARLRDRDADRSSTAMVKGER